MSNIFPICPCLDTEDARINCFKKNAENNKGNCSNKLFEKYQTIITQIKKFFNETIDEINRLDEYKLLKTVSTDYVKDS